MENAETSLGAIPLRCGVRVWYATQTMTQTGILQTIGSAAFKAYLEWTAKRKV